MNILDALAMSVIHITPFYNHSGWAIKWATRRIQPRFDAWAEEEFMKLLQAIQDDPDYQRRRVVITFWETITKEGFQVKGCAEVGLSFQGCMSTIFRRFHFQREFSILPQ